MIEDHLDAKCLRTSDSIQGTHRTIFLFLRDLIHLMERESMSQQLHPGEFVDEVVRGPLPIEGVPTSIVAIFGETERGSISPRLVTSYADYIRWFGHAFDEPKYLPDALNGFFENGGTQAYIFRIVGEGAETAQATFGNFLIQAAGAGAWGNRVLAKIVPSTKQDANGNSVGFRLQVAYWDALAPDFDPFIDPTSTPRPVAVEDFDNLVTDENSPDFYGKRIPFIDHTRGSNNLGPESSALIRLVRTHAAEPGARPEDGKQRLAAGRDAPQALGVDDFIGLANDSRQVPQGLSASEKYDDIALVYAPAVSADISQAIVSHCEKMRFRFSVIDCDPGATNVGSMSPQSSIADSSHGAFYYPWLVTLDPRTGQRKLIPPGGHVLGVYARSDRERGVFKAPANEVVRGAVDVEHQINHELENILKLKGVNTIRSFPGRAIRVWGARTLASDALWKFVSVRRLFIFLERSIEEGTQWSVFEPNDARLWGQVRLTIGNFLRTQWLQGALFGRTAEEAFFVACDRGTTMSQDDIVNGRMVCEVGIAPIRPAEFIIFRIIKKTAEAQG